MVRSTDAAGGSRRRLTSIAAQLCGHPGTSAAAPVLSPERRLYSADALRDFGSALLQAGGMAPHQAAVVSEICVEGDLLNHSTHGIALLLTALSGLQSGGQAKSGEPAVLKDTGATLCWDGGDPVLNGLYLTAKAVETALERSAEHGVATVVIRRSGHTGCLQCFLERATSQGCMVIIASSGPGVRSVAPFGGRTGTLHPNPYAVGIPASPVPILVDMSMGITANSNYRRYFDEGKKMPGKWVQAADGSATDDPSVLFDEASPGVAMGIGGQDHGHKGFGLGLMVEALTMGLSGFGRAELKEELGDMTKAQGLNDRPERAVRAGMNTFVQVLNPNAFGGVEDFDRQTSFIAAAARASPPATAAEAVRTPGQAALAHKAACLEHGVELYPGTMEKLLEAVVGLGGAGKDLVPPQPL